MMSDDKISIVEYLRVKYAAYPPPPPLQWFKLEKVLETQNT